jgi:hypothetical protein
MNIEELLAFGKMFTHIPSDSIQRISLEEQLYSPPVSWYGRFVLLPVESFENLHAFIKAGLK